MDESLNRRDFLRKTAGIALAPAFLQARPAGARYPIAFSTLGCPAWSWKTVLEQADRLGYMAVELRGIAGEMDLTKVPELTGSRQADAMRDLAALGIVISDLGASAAMHDIGDARAKAFDEGRRFIDLAHAMRVPYVRMFGDKIPEGEDRATAIARVVDGFREMSAYASKAGVTILMESHGDFTHSDDIRSFEWGKKWHPEIEDPEVAFPHYAKTMGGTWRPLASGPVS